MLSVLCATTSLLGITMAMQAEAKKPTYFVFLNSGKNPPKASDEEVGKYQMEHLGNFKRLFGEGKLLTAGPCKDDSKTKRGIVVLTVGDKSAVMACFGPDPYVQKGFLDVQALRSNVEFGKINTAEIDPEGIEENRIVVFTAGAVNPDSASVRAARVKHLEHIRTGGGKAGLAFYASLSDSPDIRAVALFKGKNDKEILAWLKKDPLVKNGTLKATKMPQWLSKGVLGY